MLYKNNKTKTLDIKMFENPSKEYRAAPFWSWNAKLTGERLCEQIECFKQMGFGGFYMHPRSGMETEYLSEEYFECISDCIKKAKSEDMLACLYDEDRWPSGFGGGMVTKTPKYRQRYMYITADSENLPDFEEDKIRAVDEGKAYLIGCYDVEFTENGYLKSYKKIGLDQAAIHTKYYAYSKTDNPSGRYNFMTGVDYLQKEAIAEFINITHNRYFEKFGREYGDTVPTIFTDEPRFGPVEQMSEKPESTGKYYWTYNLEESFKKEYGYDIVEKLPKLVWDEEGVHSFERYDFFNHISELFKEAFFKQIHSVTKAQGLMFCGHMMKEEELFPQLCWGGDIMRMYPYFDIPGIDMLFDFREFLTAKQVQSVVRQYGKEAMLSELYGVTGWDFDFKCLKMQGDWQVAMGVTLRVPHLSMYSMKGCAKRDYPASFNYQAPWYKEFKYLEDHYARLNAVFSRAKDICDVAVIHPIESIMLSVTTLEKSAEDIKIQEEKIQELMENLLYSNIDFDFLNEATIPSPNITCSSELKIGEMSYSVVLVPFVKTLRKTTVDMLERFEQMGGKVIFTGKCPQYLDGRKSDAIQKLYDKSLVITEKDKLIDFLEDIRRVKITAKGEENRKIYRFSKDGEDNWLFVAHAQRIGKTAEKRRDTTPKRTVIEVKGEFGVTVYNTLTGKTEKADYQIKNGKTYIYYDWYINDSLLLKLTKELTVKKQIEDKAMPYDTVVIEDACYVRQEENCAVLDICSVSTDGVQYNEKKCILEQNGMLYKKLWIYPTEAQPYAKKNPKSADVYTRFDFNCEDELCGLSLALERAEESRVWFNGKEIEVNVNGYYVDRDIEKIDLPNTQKGNNSIIIKQPFTEVRQIEPSYILGEFCAEVKDKEIILKPQKTDKISFAPLCEQGLTFYGGNILYKSQIVCEECIAEIIAENFTAPLLRVFVDGKDVGVIAFSPFKLRVPLSKGRHEIEFLCYGNRNNTFGPIHNSRIADPDYYIGPWSWNFRDECYSEDFCLQKTGILSNPIIKLYK